LTGRKISRRKIVRFALGIDGPMSGAALAAMLARPATARP
jgi:hypothetical protein